ncbi:hypothetical protein BC832DRAFT_352923 [Gaertneriomyces semiglobifer]|nr:hypothetical protein BC832DRAFT_352923 [Gaertneriomyces semiglobifer]
MKSAVLDVFDAFSFSIWVCDAQAYTFIFRSRDLGDVKHLQKLSQPATHPSTRVADYFVKQFPAPEVLMEHFKQAVLRNCRGAGEPSTRECNDHGEGELEVLVEAGDMGARDSELFDEVLREGGRIVEEEGHGDVRERELFEMVLQRGGRVVTFAQRLQDQTRGNVSSGSYGP